MRCQKAASGQRPQLAGCASSSGREAVVVRCPQAPRLGAHRTSRMQQDVTPRAAPGVPKLRYWRRSDPRPTLPLQLAQNSLDGSTAHGQSRRRGLPNWLGRYLAGWVLTDLILGVCRASLGFPASAGPVPATVQIPTGGEAGSGAPSGAANGVQPAYPSQHVVSDPGRCIPLTSLYPDLVSPPKGFVGAAVNRGTTSGTTFNDPAKSFIHNDFLHRRACKKECKYLI